MIKRWLTTDQDMIHYDEKKIKRVCVLMTRETHITIKMILQ